MSTWKNILNDAAKGNASRVEEYLQKQLPLELAYQAAEDSCYGSSYDGPVAKAVDHFARGLRGTSDEGLIESHADDLIDFIVDKIVSKVRRTANLVIFCYEYPELDISDIATAFTGWDGLKRSAERSREWVGDNLKSMTMCGIALPVASVAVDEGRPHLPR